VDIVSPFEEDFIVERQATRELRRIAHIQKINARLGASTTDYLSGRNSLRCCGCVRAAQFRPDKSQHHAFQFFVCARIHGGTFRAARNVLRDCRRTFSRQRAPDNQAPGKLFL
jgi:hypothetical protein